MMSVISVPSLRVLPVQTVSNASYREYKIILHVECSLVGLAYYP